MTRPTLALAIVCASISTSFAQNVTFRSDAGYTIQVPAKWTIANQAMKAQVMNSIPAQARERLKSIDLKGIDAMLLNFEDSVFVENVNIVATGETTPFNVITPEQIVQIMTEQYRSTGMNIKNAKAVKGMVDNCHAYALTYEVVAEQPMTQRQYMIATPNNTFIITCTAPTKTFAKFATTFDGIVMSFKAVK